MAFMVIVFYLWRRNKPIWFAAVPMLLMVVMPAWAMLWQMFNAGSGWFWPLRDMVIGQSEWHWQNSHLLFGFGVAIIALQAWMVVEAVMLWPRAKGVLEESLPPLETSEAALAAGRSC